MLQLDPAERAELWKRLIETIESYTSGIDRRRVTPLLAPEKIRAMLAPLDFARPLDPIQALEFAASALAEHQTHTPHPRYYGLFNPAPTTMGIAADTLVAAFNPQLAAWSHSPFAIEVEQHLVRAFGVRFGYDPSRTDGTFCSGGAEANHTALLTALANAFPAFLERGVRALPAPPVLYVSAESHHSVVKAARLSGLGMDAVREIPVDKDLRMDVGELDAGIAADRSAGFAPFLVVATAGTTNAGVVDPLDQMAETAARERLWFHVDAAWGGAAALVPELRDVLAGIQRADSITFDAHKWLSVPMGAGLYLTRHPEILPRTFRVATAYMPREADGLDVVDPHLRTIQWSRRFIGLKVFLSLLAAGWDGYAEAIRHQTAMGDRLRRELEVSGWHVLNQTPLPVVCFNDATRPDGVSAEYLQSIARALVASGKAWISTTLLARATPALRACITNHRTSPEDVDALVGDLHGARSATAVERCAG